jgi:hypothetical protein
MVEDKIGSVIVVRRIQMTTTNHNQELLPQATSPAPALKALEGLIGSWKVKGREFGSEGKIYGQVSFEWMENGAFLIQKVDLNHNGFNIKGFEYIGYDEESQSVKSRFFDTTGNLYEYVWELDGDSLTIWGGYAGSAAVFRGAFSSDNNRYSGHWEWPGGGYESTMIRIS